MAQSGGLLFDTIRATAHERMLSDSHPGMRIEPAALGGDTGALKAIALFVEYGHDEQ